MLCRERDGYHVGHIFIRSMALGTFRIPHCRSASRSARQRRFLEYKLLRHQSRRSSKLDEFVRLAPRLDSDVNVGLINSHIVHPSLSHGFDIPTTSNKPDTVDDHNAFESI